MIIVSISELLLNVRITILLNIRLAKKFIIIVVIQPLGRSGQRPEFSQATGMALVRCILGKFLRVACHCLIKLLFCL